MKIRVLILAILFSMGAVESFSQAEPPERVSIIQLIANPDKFDGKLVSLIGFMHIGREQDLIFLEESDFDHAVYANALWYHLSEEMGKNWQKLNGNYVDVVGVFSSRREGPYGCPNGGLSVVKRIGVWSTPASPTGKVLDQPKP